MEYTLYQLLWFFLVYSFLGWLMETAAAAAKKGKLLNHMDAAAWTKSVLNSGC